MKEGWVTKKLIEIGEIQTGTTPSTKTKEYYGDFIPFIKPPHFNEDGTINYDNSGLSSKGLEKGRLIKENSILMVCIGATIGKTGLTSIPVSCNQQINSFTPNANLEPKFFYYLLSSSVFFKKVLHLSSQATLPMINKSKWQSIEVSFPKSLEEQKHIVAILDKAFEAIDQAKVNIEKNIVNAKELFQSKLNDIFSQKGDGWEEKTLESFCTIGDGNYSSKYPKASEFVSDGIPFLTATNLKLGTIVDNKMRFIPYELHSSLKKGHVKEGDLVIVVRGSSTGNSSIIPAKYAGSNLNSQLAYLRANYEVNPNFLYLAFNSPLVQKVVNETISGAAQPQLPNNKLLKIKVNIPKLDKQLELVEVLNKLKIERDTLINTFHIKTNCLEELKKSILQKAFTGELTKNAVAI